MKQRRPGYQPHARVNGMTDDQGGHYAGDARTARIGLQQAHTVLSIRSEAVYSRRSTRSVRDYAGSHEATEKPE